MRQLLRLFGQARQRFQRLPHWAKDFYGMLSYLNFVELIPTLAAIAMAPRHFFRRLPQTLAGHRTHFQTPIKFFFNFSALFLGLFYMQHGDLTQMVDQSESLLYLPLLIPLTPPLMVGLGILTWVLYQLPRLAPNADAFPPPNSGHFKLLLNPSTYTKIDLPRYLWGLFYISIYFVAAWQIVQLLLAVGFLAIVELNGMLGDGHQIVKAITILLGVALAALTIHALVLHPYIELLRASLRQPTKAVFEADVFELKQVVADFLRIPNEDEHLDAHAVQLHALVEQETSQLSRTLAEQAVDFDLVPSQLNDRLDVHRSAFRIKELREKLRHVSYESRSPIEEILSRFDPPAEPSLQRAA